MKGIIENKFMKKAFAVVILFTMLFSYLPAISNAAEDDDTDYMVLEASCKKGSEVISNENVAFNYSFNLKGVPTGFKNVVLSIKDEDTTNPAAVISSSSSNKIDANTLITNSGRYSVISYGNITTGTDASGTVNVFFDRKSDFSTYQKTITFILEADYRDPITGLTTRQTIEKDVTVDVESAPLVDKFSSNVTIKQNDYTPDLGDHIDGSKLGAHYVYYNSSSEYAIDEVTASYNVKINAENFCYGKYTLKVSKNPEFKNIDLLDTNSLSNLIVDLSEVPGEIGTEVVRNNDGTTDIILTLKTKKDSYTLEDMDEAVNYDFNIKVKYKINFSYTEIVDTSSVGGGAASTRVIYNHYTTTTYTESTQGYSYTLEGPTYLMYGNYSGDIRGVVEIEQHSNAVSTGQTSVAASTTRTVSVQTYETIEEIPGDVNPDDVVEIDGERDTLYTHEGSVVTIKSNYSGESEGLDVLYSNETTTAKKHVYYSNSDSDDFLSASQIVEQAGGSHITGDTTYLDDELNAIENGNFEISFKSSGSILHKKAVDYIGELVLYNYNVENAEDFYTENNLYAGNLYYDNDCRPTIKYKKDEGLTETKTLKNNELQVKSIRIGRIPSGFDELKFYKKGQTEPFFVATSDSATYTVPENETITEYYVKTNMGMHVGDDVVTWITDYKIPVQSLRNLGLSDTEIANITEVTRYQYGSYNSSNCTMTPKGTATVIDLDSINPKLSYMEFSAKKLNEDNFNTTNTNGDREEVVFTLTLRKNTNVLRGDNTSVYDVNPTMYIKLNPIFDFDNFKVNMTTNSNIFIKNTEKVRINEQDYLKIECEGIYNSKIDEIVNVTVQCTRKLVGNSAARYQSMEAFLLTENQNYYSPSDNINGLIYNEGIPAKAFRASTSFTVEQSSLVQVFSQIGLGRKTYKSDSTDNIANFPEKEVPIIVDSNSNVKYIGYIKNSGKELNNVNIIYKLPINNSKDIQTGNDLIESDYRLSDEFKTRYGSLLTLPENQDGTVKHNSLINLNNIKVYELTNGLSNELSPSEYTVGYSTDLTASYDSVFTDYEPGVSDLTDAAVLQVKLNKINRNSNIRVEFTMDMPEDGGMAGAQVGVRYLETGDTKNTVLDSEPAYIINGDNRSDLQVQKKFEGYDAGVAPAGVSLSGIQFKLKDSTGNFVTSEGNDVIATTDAEGKATFTNLEPGQYQLIETSEFSEFNGIGNLAYIDVDLAETVEYVAENPRKKGTLNIQKHFEDTNEIPGTARFTLTRSSVDSIVYSTSITTDAEGKATILGVPYGEYTLVETGTVPGYGVPAAQTVTINSDVEDVEVTNPLGRGTIVINKTVPESESVKELSFNVSGIAAVTYTNTQGNVVTNDTDLTINLNADYSSNENINVEISENELTATITLSNLPLGFYTIEETNIPTIGEDNIKKYINVTRTVNLDADGEVETVNIINRKKTGYLQIKKTAYIDGEEKQYIGDLSKFSVRITGTSDYGTTVDKTVTLDEDGNATTALEIGTYTVTENPVDGYQTYYKNDQGNFVYSTTGTEVRISFNEFFNKGVTTTQEIENVLTGVGFVRVEKTLEGVTNPQTVLDAGIKFRIIGKNAAGGRVEETINIDQLDTTKNVAYGISNAIYVGGEYELEEMDSTIPEYYEGIIPTPVTFTTSNTQEDPLVINVQNKRSKGELQISTQTDPEGGPLTGIIYKVTEVTINNDGSFTKLDGTNGTENTVREVEGSNRQSDTGVADIKDLNAGNYLVEQVTIPAGYKKDMPQIVEVPAYGIGYAVFVIERDDFNSYTKLIVHKQILNKDNEIATSEDFEKAQLSADDSFEVKLTNVNTNDEYYTFISGAQNGTITNLPAGIYEIEEEYKPKYNLKGYYNSVDGITIDELTQTTDGKYTLEIVEGSSEAANVIEITIKNTINTSFPYGGQITVDNLSKVKVEETVTESIIYITDEDGNELSGARFQLLDSEGDPVNIGTGGNILTTKNKKILIRGLEPGAYTLTNIEVPEGYLQPDDKEVIVYEDATRVARVEIQKNIPRGMLTLSTTYKNESGDTKYVPRSKYKVVDSVTGELVRFSKTPTGDYRKSNLDDATNVITLKAGQLEIQGLEAGEYEVGLVDVTDGFGMIKEEPEFVTLVGNDVKDINVVIAKSKISQASAGYYNTMWLDDNGRLWIIGRNNYNSYGPVNKYIYDNVIPYQIQFPEDIFITKYEQAEYSTIAIDSQGRVWSWGSNYIGNGTSNGEITPVCLSEIEGSDLNEAYNNGITIKDVNACYYGYFLLDSDEKLWAWGNNSYPTGIVGNNSSDTVLSPICLTNIEGNPIYEAYENGITIAKLAEMHGSSNTAGCIDSIGRVWMWGDYNYGILGMGPDITTSQMIPVCISDIETEFSNAKIKDLSIGRNHTLAADAEGNVWAWGYNGSGRLGINNSNTQYYPQKLANTVFNGAKIKTVYAGYNVSFFIDENGKLWACGDGYNGMLGDGNTNNVYEPICVSDISNFTSDPIVNISQSIYSGDHVIALTSKGEIFGWGSYYNSELGVISYDYNDRSPKKINISYTKNLEYNLKFKKVASGSSSALALDEHGDVWGIGRDQYIGMGNKSTTYNEFIKNPVLSGKEIIDIQQANYDTYLALSKDGKVYVFGYTSNGIATNSNYNTYTPADITDQFDLEDDVKIVEIAMAYNGCAALDSLGRVWTWGSLRGSTNPSGIGYAPTCISKEVDNNLNGVNIKSLYSSYYSIVGIDDEGKIWAWGSENCLGTPLYALQKYEEYNHEIREPICLTDETDAPLGYAYKNGTRFKEFSCYLNSCYYSAFLDTDGNVWATYGNINGDGTYQTAKCLNKDENGPFYNQDENYKLEKVYALYDGIYVTDNKGVTWRISSNGYTKADEYYTIPSDITDISYGNSSSYAYLIDGYGQIWKWYSDTKCLSGVVANSLYNVKAKRIIQDGLVEMNTEKGEIYKVDSSNSYFQMYGSGYLEGYLGKFIVQKIENITTNNNDNYIIALDEDGKIWTWGGNYKVLGNNTEQGSEKPICISNIKNTELYEAYKNNPYFKIEKIELYYSSGYHVYAFDNYGGIWTWGNTNSGMMLNGTILSGVLKSPTCVTNIEGTDLYTACQEYNDFKIEEFKCDQGTIVALDNHNNIWTLDKSTGYLMRLNQKVGTDLYNIYNNSPEDGLEECMFDNYGTTFVYDGKIWQQDTSTKDYVCFTHERQGENVEFIKTITTESTYLAIDSEGKIWSWGQNEYEKSRHNYEGVRGSTIIKYYLLGDNTTTNKNVSSPVCISNISGTELYNEYINNENFKIVDIFELDYSYKVLFAQDNNGNIWAWGLNEFNVLGPSTGSCISPYCITRPLESTNATVQKIDMTVGQFDYGSYYFSYNGSQWSNSGTVYDYYSIIYVLDSNGDLWSIGGSSGNELSTKGQFDSNRRNRAQAILGSNDNKSILSKISGISNVTDFIIMPKDKPDNSDNIGIVVETNDGIYAWGSGNLGYYSARSDMNYTYTKATWGNYYTYGSLNRYTYTEYSPRLVTDLIEINKLLGYTGSYYMIIDNDGKLWAIGNVSSIAGVYDNVVCLSDTIDELKDLEFVDGYDNHLGINTVTAVDNEGNMYKFDSNTFEIITDSEATNPYTSGELANKNIISYSNSMAIDDAGNLYGWGSYVGIKGTSGTQEKPVCITKEKIIEDANFQNNKTLVNTPVENSAYGIKFTDIINDQIVLDENRDYWFFPSIGKAINISKKMLGDDNPLYGKTITKAINADYVVTSEGDIYYIGGTKPRYIMKDFTSTGIKEIRYVMEGKVNYYIAIDNLGKVWTCGSANDGILGNGKMYGDITEPICISDIENTDLYNSFQSGITMEKIFAQPDYSSCSIFVIDSVGKLWTWGLNNYSGILGNGTTNNSSRPICINNISDTEFNSVTESDNIRIEEIEFNGSRATLVDNRGMSWELNSNTYVETGIFDINKAKIKYEEELGITINELKVIKNNNDNTQRTMFMIDTNGKIWTYGYNEYGQLGNGTTNSTYTPTCINNTTALSNVHFVSIYTTNNMTIFALDDTGYVWVWGRGEIAQTGSYDTITTPNKLSINNVSDLEKSIHIFSSMGCAINDSGDTWMWGFAYSGQLGNNNQNYGAYLPFSITDYIYQQQGITVKFKSIVNNSESTYAIDTTGKVWVWGYNYNSALGNGSTSNRSTPFCISTQDNSEFSTAVIEKIACYNSSAIALDSNGNLWGWGSGYSNQFANITISKPVRVSSYVSELSNYNVIDIEFRSKNSWSGEYVAILEGGYEWVVSTSMDTLREIEPENSEEPENPEEPEEPTYDIVNIENFSKYIAEVLDGTHFRDTNGKIYSISNNGDLTELSTYTPSSAPEYEPVEIDGKTIVDYSTYKALDNEGNLYVWSDYVGGFTSAGNDSYLSVNITENEYIIEPIYQNANGWSLIKAPY